MSDRLADSAKTIGHGIRQLRKARRWKQDVLAFESGLNRSTISMAENGKTNISVFDLEQIAIALGTSIEGILAAGRTPLFVSDPVQKEILSSRVRSRRQFLNLTRKELGCRVGLLPQYISTTENARRLPLIKSLLKLATALEANPSWLLGEGDADPDCADGSAASVEDISLRLKEVRLSAGGKTREWVSKQTGITAMHLFKLETGRQLPTVATLTAFCKGMKVPYSEMLDEKLSR